MCLLQGFPSSMKMDAPDQRFFRLLQFHTFPLDSHAKFTEALFELNKYLYITLSEET